jgi:hypothetical protein
MPKSKDAKRKKVSWGVSIPQFTPTGNRAKERKKERKNGRMEETRGEEGESF